MSPVCSQPSTIVSAVLSGCLVVALHDEIAAHADLAGRALLQLGIAVVEDGHADQRVGPPDRAQALVRRELAVDEMLFGRQVGDRRRRLGLAVAARHHRAEDRDRLLQLLDRHRRRAVHDVAQRREIALVDARNVEQPVDHRRRQEELGDPVLRDRAEQGRRVGLAPGSPRCRRAPCRASTARRRCASSAPPSG